MKDSHIEHSLNYFSSTKKDGRQAWRWLKVKVADWQDIEWCNHVRKTARQFLRILNIMLPYEPNSIAPSWYIAKGSKNMSPKPYMYFGIAYNS